MAERAVAIVNPNSSGGQTGKNWDSINSTLKKYFGEDVETVFTEKSEDGSKLATSYLEKGFEKIIPIGGDGMINEVSNGFFKLNVNKNFDITDIENKNLYSFVNMEVINPKTILIILPGGTRNVLVKSLNLPSEFEECCKAVTSNDTKKLML
jgi:diacylglycerol kinase (ATP)